MSQTTTNSLRPPGPGSAGDFAAETGRPQFFARYRELVFAGIALALLILGVLFLNSYVARQLENDATGINLAGRQRMLSQRIRGAARQLKDLLNDNQSFSNTVAELRQSKTLFESTLTAFQNGGPVDGTVAGTTIRLPAAESAKSKRLIEDTLAKWQSLDPSLQRVISARGAPNREDVNELVKVTELHNQSILNYSNDLANELASLSSARASRLRWVQTGAVAGVLGLMGYMAYFFIGKLRKGDALQAAAAAKLRDTNASLEASTGKLNGLLQENALILATVRQGLMLIDAKSRIGNTYSKEFESILRVENLAGVNFLSLLQRLLTEKMYHTTRDYLDLMFNPAKKEKQLSKINPLSQVDVNFPNREGGFDTRYLEFNFRRVMDGKDISSVLVSARDITDQVLLEKQLRDAEQRKDRQFEILSSALHVEPAQFREFIESAEKELKSVNDTLKADSLVEVARGVDGQEELRKRLNSIFRAAHGLKGNAEFIGARYFVQTVHEFEDKIKELRDRPSLKPEDLLSIVILQASLVADLDEARGLLGKLGSMRGFAPRPASAPPAAPAPTAPAPTAPVPASPPRAAAPAPAARTASGGTTGATVPAPLPAGWNADSLLGSFHNMMQSLAGNLGKQVGVNADQFKEELLGGHKILVRDILIQLGRNSLAHGIETPVERMAAGKPTRGILTMGTTRTDDEGLLLVFRDDGRGLDPTKIRAKALSTKLVTAHQLSAMDDSEVVLLIFEPGFSTAKTPDEFAGRGVGLDILRQRVIDDLGGEISLDSVPGRFCEFQIQLPPTASAPASGPRA